MTRDEALDILNRENTHPGSTYRTDRDEALRVLARPCIEIEWWEVVSDVDKVWRQLTRPGVEFRLDDTNRVIVLRRCARG